MSVILRSIVFNLLFYLVLFAHLLVAMPTLLMPRRYVLAIARSWAMANLWMLRIICNIKVEFRGLEKIPSGGLIIASKHQSIWETFAFLPYVQDPTFILKRELTWIPMFGWCLWKAEMIPVDRGARGPALAAMTARAKVEVQQRGRQIIIFPEGTRRPAGAPPRYKFGVTHLYAEIGVPCVPVALNSGLFWPRRSFRRYPGTVVVQICDPIAPGLEKQALLARLQDVIETASNELLEEGKRELGPYAAEVMARAEARARL